MFRFLWHSKGEQPGNKHTEVSREKNDVMTSIMQRNHGQKWTVALRSHNRQFSVAHICGITAMVKGSIAVEHFPKCIFWRPVIYFLCVMHSSCFEIWDDTLLLMILVTFSPSCRLTRNTQNKSCSIFYYMKSVSCNALYTWALFYKNARMLLVNNKDNTVVISIKSSNYDFLLLSLPFDKVFFISFLAKGLNFVEEGF